MRNNASFVVLYTVLLTSKSAAGSKTNWFDAQHVSVCLSGFLSPLWVRAGSLRWAPFPFGRLTVKRTSTPGLWCQQRLCAAVWINIIHTRDPKTQPDAATRLSASKTCSRTADTFPFFLFYCKPQTSKSMSAKNGRLSVCARFQLHICVTS